MKEFAKGIEFLGAILSECQHSTIQFIRRGSVASGFRELLDGVSSHMEDGLVPEDFVVDVIGRVLEVVLPAYGFSKFGMLGNPSWYCWVGWCCGRCWCDGRAYWYVI